MNAKSLPQHLQLSYIRRKPAERLLESPLGRSGTCTSTRRLAQVYCEGRRENLRLPGAIKLNRPQKPSLLAALQNQQHRQSST